MSGTAAWDSAALERRYRRLLAWFPAEHRRVYGEEMIGVLLASAPDGQDRPAPADVANLVSSGLQTRLRNWSGIDRVDSRWADALAAFSLAAPILMAGFASFQLYVSVQFLGDYHSFGSRFFKGARPVHDLITWILLDATAIAAVAALIACPVLLRRGKRRAVRFMAWAVVLLGLIATVNVIAYGFAEIQVGFTAFFLLELVAVAVSPGPGRGWRALTGKGVIIAAAIAALAVIAETWLQGPILQAFRMNQGAVLLAALAVGFALILIFGSDAHKRLLALLAVPGYPLLADSYVYSYFFSYDRHPPVGELLYLPTIAITVLVALAIWQASRTTTAPGQPQAGVAG